MSIEQDDAVYVIIGHSIRQLRRQANVSQQELADFLEMSRASVVNIEAGRQRLPIHTLCIIAKRFKVPMSMMFQEVPLTSAAQEQESINMRLRMEVIRLREQIAKISSIVMQPQDEE
jgi:transcriptional regulator with XRE-family HTH domain